MLSRSSSVAGLLKQIERAANEGMKSDIDDFVQKAIEKAAEEIKARWIARLNELITLHVYQRVDMANTLEISVVFRGWESK